MANVAAWNANWPAGTTEVRKLVHQIAPGDEDTPATPGWPTCRSGFAVAERRVTEIREQTLALNRNIVRRARVAKAMAVFDPVWDSLTPANRPASCSLLVERVDYDGANGNVSITFHPSGIKTLADELASTNEEDAA